MPPPSPPLLPRPERVPVSPIRFGRSPGRADGPISSGEGRVVLAELVPVALAVAVGEKACAVCLPA